MLKIQEITIDGDVFKLREPRIADYQAARGAEPEEFMLRMLSGMLLDESGTPLGYEQVTELPLRIFNTLTDEVSKMIDSNVGPLEKKTDSSTA